MKVQKQNKKYGNLKWTDIWHLPLNYDGMSYAWGKNNTMALMFGNLTNEDIYKIVETINGNENAKIENITYENGEFLINGQMAFIVRGWGHLTGIGGRNLPSEVAAKLQNDFANHILNKLSNG